ncbi:MAG: response regulator [Acidobacteriota bacterium]|nr:response regulator [Acidobacteriota bacterium]
MPTIFAVMTDLFFLVRIMDASKALGLTVKFLKDRETVLEKAKTNPALMIFDLNCTALDPIGLIQQIKNDPATSGINTVGFVSHVQVDVKQKAEESGCDLVVARSAFAQNLPDILKRYATR